LTRFLDKLTLPATKKMRIVKNILKKLKGSSIQKNPEIFYSYYLFGLYESKPIWDWENWSKYVSILQPIIDLSPETPFIKTGQSIPVTYGKDNQNVSYNKGSLRFGRMIWNDKNNEKWTTKYCKENNWTFFDTEIAFPTRSQCAKNGCNPDLFITVHNQNLSESENPLVNQAITIHIGTHLTDEPELKKIEDSVSELAKLLNTKIAGKIKRPSSYKSELGIGYTDSFWDGTHGLLDLNELDFSENYKRYGIEKI
jgi:hypothetical protein